MAVHMTYKSASAARATRKKVAKEGASSGPALAVPFPCKMVELVEAADEETALRIAKPPTGWIPTVFKLKGTVECDGDGLYEHEQGEIAGNLFLLIYP